MRRRRRHVRLQLDDQNPTIEGIFTGFWAGHYIIRVPKVIESENRSVELDGEDVAVPKERVVMMQRFQ